MVATTSAEVPPPTWTFETDASNYQPEVPAHRPRAWDRLPKSPFARRRNGRKVWKRYEPPPKTSTSDAENCIHDETPQNVESGGAETTHNAKRLRSRALGTPQGSAKKKGSSKYVTTLRDKTLGTPRRKQVTRRSLRPDRMKALIASAAETNETATSDETDGSSNPVATADLTEKLEALQEEEAIEVERDHMQPPRDPSSEEIDEAGESPRSDKSAGEGIIHVPSSDERGYVSQREWDAPQLLGLQNAQDGIPHNQVSGECLIQLTPQSVKHQSSPPESPTPMRCMDVLDVVDAEDQNGLSDNDRQLDQEHRDIGSSSSDQPTGPEHSLRRSSRRLSDKKKATPSDEVAPDSRPTAAGRDEQKLEDDYDRAADAMPNKAGEEDIDLITVNIIYKDESLAKSQADALDVHEINLDSGNTVDESMIKRMSVVETPPVGEVGREIQVSPVKIVGGKVFDANNQSSRSPQSKTRSGTRFSDDTTMLRDFLSRAQAKKLAQGPALIADPASSAATSPRRSSRKALASLDSNSPCRKPDDLSKRPGTPPDKARLEAAHQDDGEEGAADSSPIRRSTRKRVPVATKTATGAPSFIPVRRADGTDTVVLQKSIAQQLALVTQTNTRRNKGQSKPPAVILKNLPAEVLEQATKGGHALRNCKSVGWDQRLVYYQDGTEASVAVESKPEESRPKARRLRGLGAGNGTPAPKKKTADVACSNATPASKRVSRMR
ncbi:MAG: hypothetical protein Q9220_004752 [cf. Caloplaca sp. 1 TL-2023]